MTHEEVAERMYVAMMEMDGEELAELYNREFGEGMKYEGDSMFSQAE